MSNFTYCICHKPFNTTLSPNLFPLSLLAPSLDCKGKHNPNVRKYVLTSQPIFIQFKTHQPHGDIALFTFTVHLMAQYSISNTLKV